MCMGPKQIGCGPKLLASTLADIKAGTKPSRREAGTTVDHKYAGNYFRGAQWTADGTSIISNSADNRLRTFIIPPDLLEERQQELLLHSYAEVQSAEPVRAFTTYPLFDLQDISTTLLLCSIPDHPIRLHSALSSGLVASYPLIKATTEAYISPHSLLFTGDGRNFISGSSRMLSVFDISRPGHGPLSIFSTAPSRKASKTKSLIGIKGIVSALCIEQASNILAAGTFSRHVGLYSGAGQGECLAVFRVDGNKADHEIGGRGITQLIWSPCGRYLYIAERYSGGVMVYDIRKTGQLLSWTQGRKAQSHQRLGVDLSQVHHTDGSLDMWAGGVDGHIRMWRDTHRQEGSQQPVLDWHAHNDAVSGTMLHVSGSVVASCSGQRHFERDQHDLAESDDRSTDESRRVKKITCESSLKIWVT